MLDGITFLPLDKVIDGLNFLKDIASPEYKGLIDYFEKNYISRGQKRMLDGTIKNLPPIYPMKLWNVHLVTLNDEPRTNNQCEGWNYKFLNAVGHKHPNIWKLIECIQKEENICETIEAKHYSGIPAGILLRIERRLFNSCSQ